MKTIELMEMLKTLDPEAVLILEKDEKPKSPTKIIFDTDLYRLREYIYWLNNRMEELTNLPTIGSMVRFPTKNKDQKWHYDKWFELEVKSHRYQYKEGYTDNSGHWEITVDLSIPSTSSNVQEWYETMEKKGYISPLSYYGHGEYYGND